MFNHTKKNGHDKKSYVKQADARDAAIQLSYRVSLAVVIYRCTCNNYHISSLTDFQVRELNLDVEKSAIFLKVKNNYICLPN